jgi:hypothetical protein
MRTQQRETTYVCFGRILSNVAFSLFYDLFVPTTDKKKRNYPTTTMKFVKAVLVALAAASTAEAFAPASKYLELRVATWCKCAPQGISDPHATERIDAAVELRGLFVGRREGTRRSAAAKASNTPNTSPAILFPPLPFTFDPSVANNF